MNNTIRGVRKKIKIEYTFLDLRDYIFIKSLYSIIPN